MCVASFPSLSTLPDIEVDVCGTLLYMSSEYRARKKLVLITLVEKLRAIYTTEEKSANKREEIKIGGACLKQ